MQCTVLPHITASVFINDDERGLHHDYEVWLEEVCGGPHPAPHAPTSHCRPRGRLHNRTDQACPRQALASGKPLSREERRNNADARLKRHGPPSEAVVVAVTNGRLNFGTWEQILSGQAEWLARKSRRVAADTDFGQNHRGVGMLRAIMSIVAYGSSMPQQRDGLYDKMAGMKNQTLGPRLEFGLELGGPIQVG